MSEAFTASNGLTLWIREDGIIWEGGARPRIYTEALREFFLHERDQELGRWKSPTGFYVYPLGEINGERVVQVLDELNGQSHSFAEGGGFKGVGSFYEAANDYFAAHPVSKPWHDAKPGEVWEITYRSPRGSEISNRVMTCVDDGGNISFFNEYRLHTVNYTGIESARRIWPEVSDE